MPTTVPSLLAAEVRSAGSRPFVTFYDDATGERVELSVVTYANWVAKTASLLQDELGLERGDTLLVDLPPHWLGAVWVGAAWAVGVTVIDEPGLGPADAVVCGPATVAEDASDLFLGNPVVACSLLPMAGAFRDPLPAGVLDFGRVVWGQPDAFTPYDEPEPGDLAWVDAGGGTTHADLLAGRPLEPEVRVLTDLNPVGRRGSGVLVGTLAAGGGAVWVRNADPTGWERRAAEERATHVERA